MITLQYQSADAWVSVTDYPPEKLRDAASEEYRLATQHGCARCIDEAGTVVSYFNVGITRDFWDVNRVNRRD